jgi:hypothetical protein
MSTTARVRADLNDSSLSCNKDGNRMLLFLVVVSPVLSFTSGVAMKTLMTFVFVLAIVALPVALLGATDENFHVKDKTVKSVPEPATLLLLGSAAGVAGVRKLLQNRR